MTDYGRGPGYEQWQAEDPLYGDLGGQRGPAAPVAGDWDPYAPYDPYATGQQYMPQWDGRPQPHPQQPHPQQQFAPQQFPGQQYPHQQYPQQFAPQQFPQQPYGGPAAPADPYAGPPQHGYYDQGGHGAPGGWGAAAGQPAEWQQVPADVDAEEPGGFENHPFFDDEDSASGKDFARERNRSGTDEHEESDAPDDSEEFDESEDGWGQEEKRRGGSKKRRSGCASLVMALLFTGVVGGGGYFGYQYWQAHYAAPPDYTGEGTGTVEVNIPDGASLAKMGNILKDAGVVESVDAFTAAAAKVGAKLQGGTYEMHQRMSAAAAVASMMDPASRNSLVIPEGFRAGQIYARIDHLLGLSGGTAAAAAKSANLGLPSYANGNPEGFLFPITYSLSKDSEPADLLVQMVKQAEAEYAKDDLDEQAQQIGMKPYQIIIIASLIQAEAKQPEDFGKVSRVIYNRLEQNMALGFDSTINYAMNRSTLTTTSADTRFPSLYNTYLHKGLPPGPIDNPGHEAIEAALHPTAGDWLYFVTVKPSDTRFTASAAEHERNVEAFNEYQQEHGG